MHISKWILVTASLPLFALPALSSADEAAATNACVNAFVSGLPSEQKFTVKPIESAPDLRRKDDRAYKIVLTAAGVHSGKSVAKATCIIQRDGVSITLNGKRVPLVSLADARSSAAR